MNAALAGYVGRLPPAPGAAAAAAAVDPPDPTAGFLPQLRAAGLIWRCAALLVAHVLERGFLLLSWVCVGAGALTGRLEYGWLVACAMALASTVPLHAASTWLQGVVAIGFGGLLKQRLLAGAMAADADLARTKGAGALMSEVFEAEAIDNLGATGGLATVLSLLDLLIAPVLLFWGTLAVIEIPILVAWSALLALLVAGNARARLRWTRQRAHLTSQLVENMTAHRTRVVQQAPAEWHLEEDSALDEYLIASEKLDRSTARIEAAVPRGYIVIAFVALVPAFLSGSATLSQLTISLGMILFAASAFERFCLGYNRVVPAWSAWQILKPMFDAADRRAAGGVLADAASLTNTALHVREVSFGYPGRPERVLSGCSVSIEQGDQILLQGASGSGKSTFAAVIAGSQVPSEGIVLAGGLDRYTLGDAAWRRRVALAPQYHENYLFAAPLSFNLLLARPYPHTPADFDEAVEICRELGLGPLLQRMPSGIHEFVGDTGWHLSQGERSRVFLARALLQRADVVVLDESLAALDPENLRQCLGCVMRRAPTAIVIAHP